MKLKAAGGHYLLLSPFPLGFSALCWTFWKHLGLVFLCVLVIPAFTSLFVYHYLPAPSNLVGVIQLPPLEPQAPLHLSTSPHSPHSWLSHPPPPTLSGLGNLFILSVKIILCCFSIFVLVMAPLTLSCFIPCMFSVRFIKFLLSQKCNIPCIPFSFLCIWFLSSLCTGKFSKRAIILADFIFLHATFLTVVTNRILLINTPCSFHSFDLLQCFT